MASDAKEETKQRYRLEREVCGDVYHYIVDTETNKRVCGCNGLGVPERILELHNSNESLRRELQKCMSELGRVVNAEPCGYGDAAHECPDGLDREYLAKWYELFWKRAGEIKAMIDASPVAHDIPGKVGYGSDRLIAALIDRLQAAEAQLTTERARHASMAAEFELIAAGKHPRYWTLEPGDVLFRSVGNRTPRYGDYYGFLHGRVIDQATSDWFDTPANHRPIYRRIDAPAAAEAGESPCSFTEIVSCEPAPAAAEVEDIVEHGGKRYRREAVARLPKEGETFWGSISKMVLTAPFDFRLDEYHILHEITEPLPPPVSEQKPSLQQVTELVREHGSFHKAQIATNAVPPVSEQEGERCHYYAKVNANAGATSFELRRLSGNGPGKHIAWFSDDTALAQTVDCLNRKNKDAATIRQQAAEIERLKDELSEATDSTFELKMQVLAASGGEDWFTDQDLVSHVDSLRSQLQQATEQRPTCDCGALASALHRDYCAILKPSPATAEEPEATRIVEHKGKRYRFTGRTRLPALGEHFWHHQTSEVWRAGSDFCNNQYEILEEVTELDGLHATIREQAEEIERLKAQIESLKTKPSVDDYVQAFEESTRPTVAPAEASEGMNGNSLEGTIGEQGLVAIAPAPAAESGKWAVEAAKVRPNGRLEFVVYRQGCELTQGDADDAAEWLENRAEIEAQLSKYKRDAEAWERGAGGAVENYKLSQQTNT